jgi:hypothetical protein
LRQGDVCGPILYPKFKNAPQQVIRPQGWTIEAEANDTLELPAEQRHVVIVSHCCEFNEAKRGQFLVARVQSFGQGIPDGDRAVIRAANDAVREVEDKERYDYIDTFVLEPISDCFDEQQLVSFTTVMALPMSMAIRVKERKRAELKHEHRVQFRRKFGFFFGREADDIDDAEKIAPTP